MILITLIAFLIIAIITSCFIKCNGIQSYIIKAPNQSSQLKTLILATTHGNEPAGFFALHRYIDSNPNIKKGTITIIPAVNSCGKYANQRNNPLGDFDINRSYPNHTLLNSQLTKLIDKSDWVIDLHEGFDYHKMNPSSIGSGIYPGNTQKAKYLAQELVSKINTTITDPNKEFVTMQLNGIRGSLRDYCNKHNKNYILVETSGINDIQDIKIRVNQQEIIINNIASKLHNN